MPRPLMLRARAGVSLTFDEPTTSALRRAAAEARLSVKKYVERLVIEAVQTTDEPAPPEPEQAAVGG